MFSYQLSLRGNMIHIIEKLQTDQQNWPKLDGPLTE